MKKTLSLLTSGCLALSAMPVFNTYASEIPDFIPQNFATALEFYNQHGATFIDTSDTFDCACLIFAEPVDMKDKCSIEISNENTNEIYHETFSNDGCLYQFEVIALNNTCKTPGKFDANFIRDEVVQKTYSFQGDGSGGLTETDMYSWVPDCYAEFKAFKENYGTLTTYNDYIIFCETTNPSTGYSWQCTVTGDAGLETEKEVNCSYILDMAVTGQASNYFHLIRPVKDGSIHMKWDYERTFEENSTIETIEKDFYISNDCKTIADNEISDTDLKSGEARITLVDYATGEPIKITSDHTPRVTTNIGYCIEGDSGTNWTYTGPIYPIQENPTYCDLAKFMNADLFEIDLSLLPLGYALPEDGTEIIKNENQSLDIIFKLKSDMSGDINNDGKYTVADLVLFQKWIVNASTTHLKNWKSADFNNDGTLNAFDLSLMKRKMVGSSQKTVEPDILLSGGSIFNVVGDVPYLYSGPGMDYTVIDTIPSTADVEELGFNNDNNDWVYAKYKNQNGWVKVKCANSDESNVKTTPMAWDKPVIYLYPEEETDVHVELELKNASLATTYPKYNNGWDIIASPDGSLINKADGTNHKYLFWDARNCTVKFDFSTGFCVAGEDTEAFLKEKLTYMGLTEQEMNEFIVYWLPRMEQNAYNLISFQSDTYTENAVLNITPQPDSMCRIFMTYIPKESFVEIEPQQLNTFERKGFTVIEWGGSEVK